MSIAILPVGYLRQRHISGVNMLREREPDLKVYVLCSRHPEYAEGPLSTRTNAEIVADELDAVNHEPIRLNTLSEREVAKVLIEIYEHEKHARVRVDITSTTKTVIKVVLTFSMLFGFCPYSVRAKKSYPNIERTRRILDRLFAPESTDRNRLKECIKISNVEEGLAALRKLLEERTSEIAYTLQAESPGSRVEEAILPVVKPVEFEQVDVQILVALLDLHGSVNSIKELAQTIGLTTKSKQIALAYRIRKLESWALVSTEEAGKHRRVELTSIGTGIADTLSGRNPLIRVTEAEKSELGPEALLSTSEMR